MIQQFIAGNLMANEMRTQHRQQLRNNRAGGTRTPSHVIPTAFQQMTALSQGQPIEPPAQMPVHNPDPLGLFPKSKPICRTNHGPATKQYHAQFQLDPTRP